MGKFVKGDVLIVPFPFSDLSDSKRRPVLVIATPSGDDIILCQITSRHRNNNYVIELSDNDFEDGELKVESYIRPDRTFTAEKSLIQYKAGKVKKQKQKEVEEMLLKIFSQ